MFLPCFTCAKPFNSIEALEQHKRDKQHIKGPHADDVWTTEQALESYFDALYQEKVSIMRKDRRVSRRAVLNVLEEIRKGFQTEVGAELFSKKPQCAGSTATQMKVNLADEYDFNLNMDIQMEDLEILPQGRLIWYEVEPEYVRFKIFLTIF